MNAYLSQFDGIVLVAKGALTYIPFFNTPQNKLYVCWWSRFTYPSDMRWVTPAPEHHARLLLFDRSVTTGISLYKIKKWLVAQGYDVTVLGQLDALCRMGITYVDSVLLDGKVIQTEDLKQRQKDSKGHYTFIFFHKQQSCAVNASHPVKILKSMNQEQSFEQLKQIAADIDSEGDIFIECDSSWDMGTLLLLTHILQKPMVTIGDSGEYDLDNQEAKELFKKLYD